MSEPGPPPSTLPYESSLRDGNSTARQTAWVSLLIVGILTAIGAGCVSACVAFWTVVFSLTIAPPGGPPPALPPWALAVPAAFLLIPLSIAVTEIICSVKIQGGSITAVTVAAVLIGLQIFALGALVVATIVSSTLGPSFGPKLDFMIPGLAVYIFVAAVFGAIEWLLVKVLREHRLRARRIFGFRRLQR